MEKYRDIIAYGITGALTTLLNIALYYLFERVLGLDYLLCAALAFILATVFAFFGNKYFVFRSKTRGLGEWWAEFLKFTAMRLIVGGFDVAFMFVSVGLLHFYDLAMKILSNAVVIVCNYIFGKLIIFRNKT